jgi:DNA repair exonuclease SbcCD nuclease subunit
VSTYRFLHASDLHLDSPLLGLSRYEGAPVAEMRGATRRALENLVDLALTERAAFVLLAGDIYDGPWRDFQTGLFFVRQMARLREANIEVLLVAGNHDAENQMTKRLRYPDNVHVFSSARAETRVVERWGVAVHGQSFATKAVTEDLSERYPPPVSGLLNIGLLHTSVEGRPPHDPYAPCRLAGLMAKGYDYWALGHVHQQEVLCSAPWIVFPGNLQGRHVRESGAKGCMLVEVDGGAIASAVPRSLDVARWTTCCIVAPADHDADELLERFAAALRPALAAADERPVAVRLRIAAGPGLRPTDALLNELRARGTTESAGAVWLERVVVEVDVHGHPDRALGGGPSRAGPGSDAMGSQAEASEEPTGLLSALASTPVDEELRSSLRSELAGLERKLPHEVRATLAAMLGPPSDGGGASTADDAVWAGARAFLVERLSSR